MAKRETLTERLNLYMQGDRDAVDSLLEEILPVLHEIASRELRNERYMAPVTKTELIHEVWIRNLSRGGWQINDQGHFYALASLAMRHVLVDMARKRLAVRRGGGAVSMPIEVWCPQVGDSAFADAETILQIGEAMEQLDAQHPDAARVVDMHYFSGFTLQETAANTGLTLKQVRTRWVRGLKELKILLRTS